MKTGPFPQLHLALASTLLGVLCLLGAAPALATTYVMATDREMVEGAAAVVEARILSRELAPEAAGYFTDHLVEVHEVLSGEVAGRNLVVRVPGGESPEGIGLYVEGMPDLVVGERVLLFLEPQADGTFGVRHDMLGVFHEVARAGQRVYVRGLQGARELAAPGLPDRGAYHRLRAAAPFRRWVEAVGRGREPRADYFIAPEDGLGRDGDPGRVTGQFTLFTDAGGPNANGLPLRWFAFDDGGSVGWYSQSAGQPGFSADATVAAVRAGMAAWNDDDESFVDYSLVATSGSGDGGVDGVNALVYGNADDSIRSGDFTCSGDSTSGTLAQSGAYYCRPGSVIAPPPYNGARCPSPQGYEFNAIFEAELVTNRGIECLFERLRDQPEGDLLAQRTLEELFGHGLGHTLGIDDSCTDSQVNDDTCAPEFADALMYPFPHADGRGAVLNSDDREAVRFLYSDSVPSYPDIPDPPAAPSDLTAEVYENVNVLLQWQDNSDNEYWFVVEMSVAGGDFETYDDTVSSTSRFEPNFDIWGLEHHTRYAFRVRARNPGGISAPSNVVEVVTDEGVPPAPSNLVARPARPGSVALAWEDHSDGEAGYLVEARTAHSGRWGVEQETGGAEPGSSRVETVVRYLDNGRPYAFRVRARNERGASPPSNVAAATPDETPDGCVEDATTLCLLDDRFRVRVDWRNQYAAKRDTGDGRAEKLSDRSGTFWFFREDNVELIVKVLDGTGVNGFHWTFYGALTDVEYWITVVDTEDGGSRTYYNPPGERCGRLDTVSIPEGTSGDPAALGALRALRVPASAVATGGAEAGICVPSETTLCLLNGRFAVAVDWDDQHNDRTGVGRAVPAEGSDRTGYFWFFNDANVELVVKALDGRPLNDHFWIFYGALTDVGYEITVADTVGRVSKTYVNEPFHQCGQFDNSAFFAPGGE